MGQALQIRVSAVTWDYDLLEKLWPQSYALALSVPNQKGKMGILEMVKALANGLRFLDWSNKRKQAMGPLIEKAAKQCSELEEALANWQPSVANRLSEDLEKSLDQLEKAFTL